MTKQHSSNIIQQIAEKYGYDAMRDVWIEELLELLTKLNHQRSGRKEVIDAAIITEIADVSFCLDQMMYFFDKNECLDEKDFKIKRTSERLL